MQINKIIIVTTSLLIGALGYFVVTKQSKCRVARDNQSIIVGTAAGYAPFASINEHGEYEGFDIDVATALAAQLQKKLELADLGSMTSLMMALEQGSIDAIIWGVSITQARLKKFAMIHYQGEPTQAYSLLFWQKMPAGINSINDMTGMTVCVEPSSSQSDVLKKYADIVVLPTEKVDDALLNIQYGKADAAFVEPSIAKKFKNKFPEIKILSVPLAPEDHVNGIGIVVKKDNAMLIEQIQKAVQTLKNQGAMSVLAQKWGIE